MAIDNSLERSYFLSGAALYIWIGAVMFLWGFAFLYLPDGTPEWLQRAQAVCFGSDENGLPNTGGWILLIVAPLSFLLALLLSMKQELIVYIQQSSGKRSFRVTNTIIVIFGIFEAVWVTTRIKNALALSAPIPIQKESDLPEGYARLNREVNGFNLVDQNGRKLSLESFQGKTVVLTFAFAHCRTVCPLLIKNSQAAVRQIDRDKTVLVAITLDPWRDTPSSLPSLARQWDFTTNEMILSGEVAQVEKALASFDVLRQRDEKTGDVVHPALVYVLDKKGKIAYAFNNPPVQWLVDALNILGNE